MFSIGAKVKVVQDATGLTMGKIYTVLSPSEHYTAYGRLVDPCMDTTIVGDDGKINTWLNNRFELVKEEVLLVVDILEQFKSPNIDYFKITQEVSGAI